MERTESVVIQVAPDYENEKIKDMETFGWNLQNRQEVHQEGDAFGRPSYLNSNTYIVKTKVSHYVKLHFVRSLSLGNLQSIKRLEAERENLPFPPLPSLGWPIGVTAFFVLGVIFVMGGTIPAAALVVYLPLAALGAFWTYRRVDKRKIATEQRQRSGNRASEILIEAGVLTEVRAQAASAN